MRRHPLRLVVAPLVVGAAAVALFASRADHTGTARAQVPNRLYGSVTLNGSPAPTGTTITAYTGDKVCGTTTVSGTVINATTPPYVYPYQFDVPNGAFDQACKPGAVLTFKVGTATAGQTYTLGDSGNFTRLDLTAPGVPNVPTPVPTATATPAPTRAISLAFGCTDYTSTFPDGTTPDAIVAAVSPSANFSGLWRYDGDQTGYRGFAPGAADANDLTTVKRGEVLRICVTDTATLTAPA